MLPTIIYLKQYFYLQYVYIFLIKDKCYKIQNTVLFKILANLKIIKIVTLGPSYNILSYIGDFCTLHSPTLFSDIFTFKKVAKLSSSQLGECSRKIFPPYFSSPSTLHLPLSHALPFFFSESFQNNSVNL